MRLCVAVFLICSGIACAPSEEDVQADFARIVESSNRCELDGDCVSVSPGCPLGCGVSVNRAQAAKVLARGHALIADYERYGRSCEYDCSGFGEPACVEQRCTFAELDEGDDGTDASASH